MQHALLKVNLHYDILGSKPWINFYHQCSRGCTQQCYVSMNKNKCVAFIISRFISRYEIGAPPVPLLVCNVLYWNYITYIRHCNHLKSFQFSSFVLLLVKPLVTLENNILLFLSTPSRGTFLYFRCLLGQTAESCFTPFMVWNGAWSNANEVLGWFYERTHSSWNTPVIRTRKGFTRLFMNDLWKCEQRAYAVFYSRHIRFF